MSHNQLILQEGAILIADAHYSFKHPQLLSFLQAIHNKKIITTQLILMGDIFDLLFTDIKLTLQRNREVIDLVNLLSKKIDIIYLEGNHDFNLMEIFPKVKIFPLREQPVKALWLNRNVGLAHGDFGNNLSYKIYTSLIRNRFIQKSLNIIDQIGDHFIINKLDNKLKHREDCRTIDTFDKYVKKHLLTINLKEYDYFIEGHFHQNSQFKIEKCQYINLPAFACHEFYGVIQADIKQKIIKNSVFNMERKDE